MANPLFVKGNKIAVGNPGGGRKTKAIEFKVALDKEIVKRDAEWILNKANNIVGKVLNVIDDKDTITLTEVNLASPFVLRGMAEKKQIDVGKTLEDILKKFGK